MGQVALVMSQQVQDVLGPEGAARLRADAAGGRYTCTCGRQVHPKRQSASVQVVTNGHTAVVTLAHATCRPSVVTFEQDLDSRAAAAFADGMDALASFGAIWGQPLLAFGSVGSVSFSADGGGLVDASVSSYLGYGFTLATLALDEIDPRTVPVLAGWATTPTGRELTLAGPDRTGGTVQAYAQRADPPVASWVAQFAPGPALVLTGSGITPGPVGDSWGEAIERARLAGRLVAARVPIHFRR